MFEIDKTLRNEFVKAIWKRRRKPRPFFDYAEKNPGLPTRFIAEKSDVICAVQSCYRAGVPFRWMQRRQRDCPPCLDVIGERIYDFFNRKPNTANNQASFDAFHDRLCTYLTESMTYYCPSFSYGNAQKLVNMTFKYLACCADYDKFKGLFAYCHLPIDRKVLTYLESQFHVSNVRHKTFKKTPWSKLDKSKYQKLCLAYRNSLDNHRHGHTYLGIDFHLWMGRTTFPANGTPITIGLKFFDNDR